jgi:hypothetical protein
MNEHDLKMNFLRTLQSSAATAKRRRPQAGKTRGGRAYRDTTRGEVSLPLSVHPIHADEARALTKAAGLSGIDFAPDGTCIVSDEKHKRKYAEMTGYSDHNSRNGS